MAGDEGDKPDRGDKGDTGSKGVPVRLVFSLFLLSTCVVGFTGFFITYISNKDALDKLASAVVHETHGEVSSRVLRFAEPLQRTVTNIRLPVLTADFRDRRFEDGRGAYYADDWRVPPSVTAYDRAHMSFWQLPVELRLFYLGAEPDMRNYLREFKYQGDNLLTLGVSNGEGGGFSVWENRHAFSQSTADKNNVLWQYFQNTTDNCWDHDESFCTTTWRHLYDEDKTQAVKRFPLNTSVRTWFTSTVAKGRQHWGKVYYRRTIKELSIPACSPFWWGDGSLKAVGCREAPISLLNGLMSQGATAIKEILDAPATVFLVETRTGFLLSSSDLDQPVGDLSNGTLCTATPDECRFDVVDVANALISSVARGILERYGTWEAAPKAGSTLVLGTRNGDAFVAHGRVTDRFDLDWSLVVTLMQDDVMKDVNEQTIYTLIICCVLIAVSLCIDSTVVCLITQPIKGLSEAMAATARLELENANPGRLSVIRELRTMQIVFQGMVHQLRIYRGFLPQAVLINEAHESSESVVSPKAFTIMTADSDKDAVTQAHGESNPLNPVGAVRRDPTAIQEKEAKPGFHPADLTGALHARRATLCRSFLSTQPSLETDSSVIVRTYLEAVLASAKVYDGIALQVAPTSTGLSVLLSWNSHSRNVSHMAQGLGCAHSITERLGDEMPSRWWCTGVASGLVHVGNIGTDDSRSPAVIGGVLVHVSRLESLMRSINARCVVTGTVADGSRRMTTRIADTVQFNHIPGVVNVHRVQLRDENLLSGLDLFLEAYSALRQGQTVQATAQFEEFMTAHPRDPDATRLLVISRRLSERGSSSAYIKNEANWDGTGWEGPTVESGAPATVETVPVSPTAPPEQLSDANIRERITTAVRDTNAGGGAPGTLPSTVTDQSGRIYLRSNKLLGKGAYGEVWLGMIATGEQVAIKCLRLPQRQGDHEPGAAALSSFFQGVEDEPETENNPSSGSNSCTITARGKGVVDALASEMTLLSTLRHDNVVGYYSSSIAHGYVFICMEYVPGGCLSLVLRQFDQRLPRPTVKRYTRDILSGLEYLHDAQIAHQDLKPANVLVSIDGQCKLADFGTSVELNRLTVDHDQSDAAHQPIGTPYYMAPEAACGHRTLSSDIWSLGITYHEIATGQLPWPPPVVREGGTAFVFALASTPPPEPELLFVQSSSDPAVDFATQCLRIDAAARPSSKQLSEHPYFSDTVKTPS
eukprot:Hpha_TRINITY_DN15240_c5_g3::TRINITY_DN15240_c5_g3_i1::g.66187::m.66187